MMSPPGHRVSQLPQRRLDHAGEGRSGRSGAAGPARLGESALSQPSSCRNHPESHPGKGPAGMPPNCLPHLPRLPMNQETYILAAPWVGTPPSLLRTGCLIDPLGFASGGTGITCLERDLPGIQEAMI